MTLLALLSTAVPVASAQETTDESFYELTTTPSGGDMIVGEPGTTILFDSSNGELVDVLPPSEAEDYSVTVSRGCADSNAGCWADVCNGLLPEGVRIATADGSGVDGVSVTRW